MLDKLGQLSWEIIGSLAARLGTRSRTRHTPAQRYGGWLPQSDSMLKPTEA